MSKFEIEDLLKERSKDLNLMERVDQIGEEMMSNVGDKNPHYKGIYSHNVRLAAMAIAVSEELCRELSMTSPSDWVSEQKSREGNSRQKADPKIKELAAFLQLSGQLLTKCYEIVWRLQ